MAISEECAAIKVTDLWKSYDGNPVLKGLNLAIPRGKVLVILGKSGVGKSVLLRAVLGLDKPDRGVIEVEGKISLCLSKTNFIGL